jgi:hypothetical protein
MFTITKNRGNAMGAFYLKTTFIQVVFFIHITYLLTACDHVHITNADGDVGFLVDGKRLDSINDEGFVGTGNNDIDFEIGFIQSTPIASEHNWVVGFGANRAPTYMDTPWTTSKDVFNLLLNDTIDVPLDIWILEGPYTDQALRAAAAVATANAIWQAERAGLQISSVNYHDETANPNLTLQLLNPISLTLNWNDYPNLIGSTSGRINIYYLNTIKLRSGYGISDFGSNILMSKNTIDQILVHELGHALNLQHPVSSYTASPTFDKTNVMWHSSSSREFLSEGQIFRAHFDAASAVNAIFAARVGQPTTNCQSFTGDTTCPTLERRLWADGTFPAN